MKNLVVFATVIATAIFSISANAEPKALGTQNGFTYYSDGFMTVNGDEYDPADPTAGPLNDYLESIGEIIRVPEPLLHKIADGGCDERISIHVKKSEQKLYLYENCSGTPTYVWLTSTGVPGRSTPDFDTFASGRLGSQKHQSGKYPGGCTVNGVRYGNMSNAVYLEDGGGNYAIHGGCEEPRLGTRRSHGCIRIARANAKLLRDMVEGVIAEYGRKSVRIRVTD